MHSIHTQTTLEFGSLHLWCDDAIVECIATEMEWIAFVEFVIWRDEWSQCDVWMKSTTTSFVATIASIVQWSVGSIAKKTNLVEEWDWCCWYWVMRGQRAASRRSRISHAAIDSQSQRPSLNVHRILHGVVNNWQSSIRWRVIVIEFVRSFALCVPW